MQKTTVLMIVHNQKEVLIQSVEAIRKYTVMENLQVVIIDNASEDGTREWLEEQNDIAYAVEETFNEMWGNLANEAIEVFGIDGDILFMQAGCLVTTGCIERLKKGLYEADNIAVVGPVINGKNIDVDAYLNQEKKNSKIVLELDEKMVMIRGDIFHNFFNRKFEEGYHTYQYAILDYYLSVMKKGNMLSCIKNTMAMCVTNEQIDLSKLKSVDYKKLSEKWGMTYINTKSNEMLIDMLDRKTDEVFSVLEIGCDCGVTLLEIKNRFPNVKTYGYEINPNAVDIAKNFAEVEVGNVEDEQFSYDKEQFDYIIFGDVLEHLHNPERVITYCRSFLKESGCIIASIPNLMHISVIGKLLEGKFEYTDTGLLDRTHIHFFTFNEILHMFNNAGYIVEDTVAKGVKITEEEKIMTDKIMSIVETSERWMFEAFQYVLRCRKEM